MHQLVQSDKTAKEYQAYFSLQGRRPVGLQVCSLLVLIARFGNSTRSGESHTQRKMSSDMVGHPSQGFAVVVDGLFKISL